MKHAIVTPFSGAGTVCPPSSKSELHRILIAASLADQGTEIKCSHLSDDVRATMRCLTALGVGIKESEAGLLVSPIKECPVNHPILDCGESGSTLRFLLPVSAALGGASLTGKGRLPQRPINELKAAMEAHGAFFSGETLPFAVGGRMTGGEFRLPGNISSQYITGLMLAAPLIGETVIHIDGLLQSADYVHMTKDVMRRFGIDVSFDGKKVMIRGEQKYRSPKVIDAGGDWSAAAFPLCLGALGGPVTVRNVKQDSIQGDRRIADILEKAGAEIRQTQDTCSIRRKRLRGLSIDASDIPDLVPVLAALMMHAEGRTIFTHAERLRLKESDRLATTCAMVNSLGGHAEIHRDELVIEGKEKCPGGVAAGANDHRIVMASLIGASACENPSTITDTEAVAKSWPSFFEDMQSLGGNVHVVDVR